jgi:decaprenyl-phosphate phosphoribosyltransferase
MTAAAEAHADSAIGALVRGMRPGQWIKNLLVVAAPFMAGRLDERSVQLATVGALVCFVAVAAAGYLFNDLYDVTAERVHPVRRDRRPLASGELSRTQAIAACVFLTVFALGLSAAINV